MGEDTEAPIATIALRQVRVSRNGNDDANSMNRLVPYLDLFGRLSDAELARLASVTPSVAADLRRQVVQVDRALERFVDLLPRLSDSELVRLTGATAKTIRFWRLCQPRGGPAAATHSGPPQETSWSVARAAEKLGKVALATDLPARGGDPIDSGAPLRREGATRREGSDEHARASRHGSDEHARASRHGSDEHARVSRHGSGERGSAADRHPSGETPGVPPRRHPSGETPGVSAPTRHPSGETPGGGASARHSSGERAHYRMPDEERDSGPGQRRPIPPPSDLDHAGRRRPTPPEQPAAGQRFSPPPRRSSEDSQNFAAAAAAAAAKARGESAVPEVHQHQAVSEQMDISGAPFPGYDSEASGGQEDDGIFIGLELPDPRTLAQPGRSD